MVLTKGLSGFSLHSPAVGAWDTWRWLIPSLRTTNCQKVHQTVPESTPYDFHLVLHVLTFRPLTGWGTLVF